jgi:nucleobase:cation symporter-1, NCS1 family
VAEIFKPDGIYGRWAWRGIAAYLIGLGAMVPFFSTPRFARSIDLDGEARLARQEIEELERAATAHAAI